MKTEKIRICPVCGSENQMELTEVQLGIPQSYHLPKQYSVVKCEKCGFCFANTVATLEDYDYYYQNCNAYSGTPIEENVWNNIYDPALEIIQQHMKKTDNILDMGFGKGLLLKRLKEKEYHNLVGIDPSENSVNQLKREGIETRQGSILDEVDQKWYDTTQCALLMDVLEHLLCPKDAICNLQKYLKKNAYILVSVPNYANLYNYKYPIANVFNHEHINYFSEKSLDNLMNACNMKKKECVSVKTNAMDEIIALYQVIDIDSLIELDYDNKTEESIEAYISFFEKKKQDIEEKLIRLRRTEERVYVWGTGAYTSWLLDNTSLNTFDITFIDNNVAKVGEYMYDKVIIAPEKITDIRAPILICSMLYAKKIANQINTMKLHNDVYIL